MSAHKCVVIVAAFDQARVTKAAKTQEELENGPFDFVDVYRDYEAKGALGPHMAVLKAFVNSSYKSFDVLSIVPEDSLFASDWERGFFQARKFLDEGPCFVDMHSKVFKNPITSWVETVDGFTGIGATATKSTWSALYNYIILHKLVDETETVSKFRFDELVNIFCQTTGTKIFIPGRSYLDHDISIPSLDGNEHQTQEGHLVRSNPHFTEGAPATVTPEVYRPIRVYVNNHYRFYWTMTPEQRRSTGYVSAVYKTQRVEPEP